MSPPDWNWADFCGTQLLQVARDHREKLPADLREALDAAIRHAARSVQRRNVGPGYTNIAIMGTYVTLATAEMFGIADLRKYAIERLRRFHEYTLRQGAFTEYNSPTYTVVALKELGRMRLHIRDAEARRLVEELYRVAWEEIAWHFHAPTRQWAGPHSRSYSTLLGRGVLALIQRSTEGRVALGAEDLALDEVRPAVPCPRDLEPCFRELTVPRPLVKTFLKGDPPLVGTTHLDPDFALGSVNRGDLWNQRRPLLAYWGTAAAPGSFRVRCLHDGYDFAAAQFFSAQQGGDVLAAVVFATDGGDTHVSLDRLTNATFHARDLRLRFEFGGAAAATKVPVPAALSDTVRLRFDRVRLQLAVHRAVFGQEHCRWEAGGDKEASTLDLVLYQGPGRSVNLAELQAAAVGFALRIDTGGVKLPSVLPGSKEGWMAMRWGSLALAVPSRPDRVAVLQRSAVFQ